MGITDSIVRSKDDLVKPRYKSYWGYSLDINLLKLKDMSKKLKPSPSEKRALKHELSGIEPVSDLIVLNNNKNNLGRFTTSQIKEMFDDIGFNVDVLVGERRDADISAVMNVGGYSIPGWVKLARFITKFFPSNEKLLLTKLSPGKDRLHIRMFENNDGSWLIAAHTDHNWLSLNLYKVYKAHGSYGAGDYVTGTRIMYELLRKFSWYLKNNKVLPTKEIDKIVSWAYYQSLADKLKISIDSNLAII